MNTKTFCTVLVTVVLLLNACTNHGAGYKARLEASPQYSQAKGKFVNASPTQRAKPANTLAAAREFYFNGHPDSVPKHSIPVAPLNAQEFVPQQNAPFRFTRLGHSSLLMQLDGSNWLLDPVFSQRASPVQWAGPKRFHELPLAVADLPAIQGVVISHNHYDHLDHGAIEQLKDRVQHFLVPLGLGATLQSWGVQAEKITELDWWQSITIGSVEFTATPSQHFSGRGLFDGDQTLWSSWVIKTRNTSVFFSGDSGYFEGFKTIGAKLGPFDYAFMECGAYNKLWARVHMMPEQTVQAFEDVQGKVLVPVHNGTFDLSTHAWYDPLESVARLAAEKNIELLTPVMGTVVEQGKPHEQTFWWRSIM